MTEVIKYRYLESCLLKILKNCKIKITEKDQSQITYKVIIRKKKRTKLNHIPIHKESPQRHDPKKKIVTYYSGSSNNTVGLNIVSL